MTLDLPAITIPVTLTAEQSALLDRLRVATGETRDEMATRLLAEHVNWFLIHGVGA